MIRARASARALAALAAGCVLLGVFPTAVIGAIDHVNGLLLDTSVGAAGQSTWLLLAPMAIGRASYSPLIVLAVIVAVVLITMEVVHRVWHGRVRRAPAWDCGFPLQTARMQDTAEGFGQPIRQVFEPFFRMERHLPSPFDDAPHYRVRATDHLGTGCICRSCARPTRSGVSRASFSGAELRFT